MKVHLLVIADSLHYDSGLNSRQSYIDQFVQQLERGGQEVAVTYYAPMALCTIAEVLQRVPLRRYDLIILQVANRHLRDSRLALRPTAGGKLLEHLMAWKLRIQSFLVTIRPLSEVHAHLSTILETLRFHRARVILMTPFPHREPVSGWLRRKGSAILKSACRHRGFRVFDVQSLIDSREEFFITGDRERLNAISHELIGRRLYDFYRTEPSITTGHLKLDT
ncbi:hypothetical protein GCM10028803_03400 [Larkinella knui]|uniref:SGNH/GDSL hydrolase family protein n=1 Tax=Larkinella knui TaxID=2025310 RepID=A0A3P1CL47_9BACT|nr:hypothetical protein [Larkinella knui]RRB13969.1 hypothetical protein EHT87_17105 [Larkinella knui]